MVDKIVEEFAQKLREKFGDKVEQVILFGSYARDEFGEESDLDVLVIGNVKLDEVLDVSYPLSLKYAVYISPIVMDRDYFEMLKAEGTGFVKNVLREGVTIYARA